MNHDSSDNTFVLGILNPVKTIAMVGEDTAIALPG